MLDLECRRDSFVRLLTGDVAEWPLQLPSVKYKAVLWRINYAQIAQSLFHMRNLALCA